MTGLSGLARRAGSSVGVSSGGSALSYKWDGNVCSRDGWTGIFTNTGSTEFTGRLYAVARKGGTIVADDFETLFHVAPGDSQAVEFVWLADSLDTCSMVNVSQS